MALFAVRLNADSDPDGLIRLIHFVATSSIRESALDIMMEHACYWNHSSFSMGVFNVAIASATPVRPALEDHLFAKEFSAMDLK